MRNASRLSLFWETRAKRRAQKKANGPRDACRIFGRIFRLDG